MHQDYLQELNLLSNNSILKRFNKILMSQDYLQELNLQSTNSILKQFNKSLIPQGYLQELNSLSTNSILKQFNKSLIPQGYLQELNLQSTNSILKQFNKSLIPQGCLQELNSLSTNSILKQFNKSLMPQVYLQELNSLSTNSILKQFNKPLMAQGYLQEQIDKYLEPQRRLQELIFPSNSSILKQVNNALRTQGLLQEQMELMDSVHINEDGTFSVDDVLISEECVSECINSISVDYESHIDFISYFIEWLKNLDGPLRAVIANLTATNINTFVTIVGIVVTIAALPSCENEQKEFPIRMAKKEIIRGANEVYSIEDLRGYLFVSTRILRVRNFGSNNADIVDELYIGKVVRLIEKSKSWCLVEYSDSDADEPKQGWVFSRYLSRFNK